MTIEFLANMLATQVINLCHMVDGEVYVVLEGNHFLPKGKEERVRKEKKEEKFVQAEYHRTTQLVPVETLVCLYKDSLSMPDCTP